MTTQTITTLIFIILSILAYYFKLHIKVITYFAKRENQWAIDAAKNLHSQKEIKDAKRKLRKFKLYCELADIESEANGNIRYYVLETNQGGYRLFTRYGYLLWLKRKGMKGDDTMLIKDAVYWTKNKEKSEPIKNNQNENPKV